MVGHGWGVLRGAEGMMAIDIEAPGPWVVGWLAGWLDGWVGYGLAGWMDGWMVHGWMDGWAMDGWMGHGWEVVRGAED